MDKRSDGIVELTASNFDKTIEDGVVLVDFYGENCPSCNGQDIILDSVFESMSAEVKFAKEVKFTRIEAKKYLSLAGGRFNIKNLPTTIIFKDGVELKRFAGLIGEEPLIIELNKALK